MDNNLTTVLRFFVAVWCVLLLSACASNQASKSSKLMSMVKTADRYYELGMLSDAEGKYRAVLKKYPNYYEAWLKLGNIFIRTDQLDAAILAYKSCAKRAPEDVRCWNNLALARVKQAVHSLENGKSSITDSTQEYRDLEQFQLKLISVLSSD